MHKHKKKLLALPLLNVFAAVSILFSSLVLLTPGIAEAAPAKCFNGRPGSHPEVTCIDSDDLQPSTPLKNDKCYFKTGVTKGDIGENTYKEVNCTTKEYVTGGDSPSAYADETEKKKQSCELSNGTWEVGGTADHPQFSCKCPSGYTATPTPSDSGVMHTICIIDHVDSGDADGECDGRASDDSCDPNGYVDNVAGDCQDAGGNNCIVGDIQLILNALTIGVGIVVTIAIVIGGIQYSLSRDNPQAVQAAKTRILNAVIAMIAFLFLAAFLQWLVPGGVF